MADQQRSYAEMSESEKKKEDWMNSKWRPMMGWMYMIVCVCDFVVFPVMWAVLHAVMHSTNVTQWNPLTLQGAGLFHLAMGAVLGLAAWGRTQEKLGGANNGGLPPTSQTVTTTFGGAPGFGSTPAPAFGSAPSSFGSTPAPSTFGAAPSTFGAAPVAASSGKLGPAPVADPVL